MARGKAVSTQIWILANSFIVVILFISILSFVASNGAKEDVAKLRHDAGTINLAGAQRMLTQKIAKQIEAINHGDIELTPAVETDINRFNRVLNALLNGDSELGVAPPPNNEVRDEVNATLMLWIPFREQLVQFLKTVNLTQGAVEYVQKNNVSLFDEANELVTLMGRKGIRSDKIAVAGRLRALSQRTAKASFEYNGGDASARAELEQFSLLYERILESLLSGENMINDSECRNLLLLLREHQIPFLNEIKKLLKNTPAKNEALTFIRQENIPLLNQMHSAVLVWTQYSTKNTDHLVSRLNTSLIVQIIISLAAVIIALVFTVLLVRSINTILKRLIVDLGEQSNQMTLASNSVAKSSCNLADGATSSASSLEQISGNLDEILSVTKQNSENSELADNLMKESLSQTCEGRNIMTNLHEAMLIIEDSSNKTSQIIQSINDIAFQTNLLALNAAVEAARAGEAGKGFAVVAEEVRNLAQRSAEAARDTTDIIEESRKNAEKGLKLTKDMRDSMNIINDGIVKTAGTVAEITRASHEQASGVEQVSLTIIDLEGTTQNNAATSEESASASEELSAQAKSMHRSVQLLGRLVN